MKVNERIRAMHQHAQERYGRLKSEVNGLLEPKIDGLGWFFTWRLKELESFALKIETGRFDDPTALEDFFACTIVVHTLSQIGDAEELIGRHFDLRDRRPPDDSRTHKRSSDFTFDDLRLYVARRSQSSGVHADLDGIVFEVQIKTVLQYAWSLATHDLIYKTDAVSWPKERIAYQIKAMLEHAEIVIAEAARLADSTSLTKQDAGTESIRSVIDQAQGFWTQEPLPEDRKRLAENLLGLLKAADMGVDQMQALLQAELSRLGMIPLDLDPYAFMLQALAHSNQIDFERKFKRSGVKTKIVIHDGMELPDWMRQGHARIVDLGKVSLP